MIINNIRPIDVEIVIECEICNMPAQGSIVYDDGEEIIGCATCILEIASVPAKPIHQIIEWEK